MKELLNNQAILLSLAIPLFMVADMLSGALNAELNHKFSWDVLKGSFIKYGGLLLVAVFLYAGGALSGQALEQVLGESLYIKEAILLGLATYGVKYLASALENLKAISNVKTSRKGE